MRLLNLLVLVTVFLTFSGVAYAQLDLNKMMQGLGSAVQDLQKQLDQQKNQRPGSPSQTPATEGKPSSNEENVERRAREKKGAQEAARKAREKRKAQEAARKVQEKKRAQEATLKAEQDEQKQKDAEVSIDEFVAAYKMKTEVENTILNEP